MIAGLAKAAEPDFSLVGTSAPPKLSYSEKVRLLKQKKYGFIMPTIVGKTDRTVETDPKPSAPDDEPTTPKPDGEGWQWDKQKKTWWRYNAELKLVTPVFTPMASPPAYFSRNVCGPSG